MSILSDDEIVERAIRHVESLEFELDMARLLLRTAIERGSWKHFRTPNGNEVRHGRFADFVVAPRPSGLEVRRGSLRELLDLNAAD